MAEPDRGEVWLTDLGMAAKIRPGLVMGAPTDPQDRALVCIVPHTTSLHGTRFEIALPKPFLKPGAFEAQGLAAVPRVKFIRKLGALQPGELAQVEAAVRRWLGL